jgi:hypothetical protein
LIEPKLLNLIYFKKYVLIFVVLLLSFSWFVFSYLTYESNQENSSNANFTNIQVQQSGSIIPNAGLSIDSQEQEREKTVRVFKEAIEKTNANPINGQPIEYPDLVTAIRETERLKVKDSGISPFGTK